MHSSTPISKVMGITVVSYDQPSLTVAAPLELTINPHQSVFGVSFFSVAILAGWSLMQLKLSELLLDCNTVVMGGEVSDEKSVLDDLQCVYGLLNDSAKVFEALVRDGAALITLTLLYKSNGKDAMHLAARYPVKKRPGPDK